MNCPKCSHENPDEAKFCGSCGASLVGGGAGPEPTSPGSDQNMGLKTTGTGLDQNLAALLSYVLGWITGIVFFIIEKDNNYVRFHAMQSIVVFGAFTVVQIVLGILSWIPFIGILFWICQIILGLIALVIWIVCMVKAYQGERFKLPIAGDIAEKQVTS